jgi:outer membrane protein assembly factor BamD
MTFRLLMTCAVLVPLVAASAMAQTVPAATPPAATSSAEQEAYDKAAALDSAGSRGRAISRYKRFIKDFPVSPLAAEAQFRIAALYEAVGRPTRAFEEYQKLVTKYPDTRHFEDAVRSQVDIANAFLGGKKAKFFGLPILPATDRAEEMYVSILENAPYSRNAPVAQFNLGITYERQGLAKEAAAAYQRVLDLYPNSPIADDALYQIAYVYMRLGESGRSEDLSALVSAKNTFEDFLFQYPESEKAPQAEDNLSTITEKESGDLLAIAKFYDRKKDYRAAAIYYNDVIRRSPDVAAADAARGRIEELRAEVGDEALASGPERAETGGRAALRRRLQAQVETSALPDFNGPPRGAIVPDELPVVTRPRLRTDMDNTPPMPAVEPALPTE